MSSRIKLGDLEVNRLGFGAMRVLGSPDIWGPPRDPANAKKVLRRAYELGANFFDTAESYGPHTDEMVIAEAMHFVAADFRGPALLAEFITASRAVVHDLSQPAELRAAAALMAKYADTPMDYADATLLLLAERLGVPDIVTLDRRGFSIYRTRKGKAMRIFNRS